MPDLLDRIAELLFGPKATDVPDDGGHGHGDAGRGGGHGDAAAGHGPDDKAHGHAPATPAQGETKPAH